ncbi:hypothetical protein SAMN05444266_101602 [Chitinophaga jiangningensis]|uniref:Phage integrase family protein n=1 Tax=Chitinophaga jiangningensis TaxID=1419482 RepID=A0A1M6WF78_9BACT|nr:hypothetical protein [Chitinophaga jiangningensis]SHK92338.1 hypothetical protein SAMN05444266_101602 [Chitinophaga jiangningensis]
MKNLQYETPKALPNNCRRSRYAVHPANWNTTRPKMTVQWRITYRFYDPRQTLRWPKGYQKVLQDGIMEKTTPAGRQAVVQFLLDLEERLLDQGYNPIEKSIKLTKRPIADTEVIAISRSTAFTASLDFGLKARKLSAKTKADIKKIFPHVIKAASELYHNKETDTILRNRLSSADVPLSNMPVFQIQKLHIRAIVDQVDKNLTKPGEPWSANMYNRYLSYLSMVFIGLIESGIISENPVKGIPQKMITEEASERPTLTQEQSDFIVNALLADPIKYSFGRFVSIFRSSGGRESEFARLQAKHVSLQDRTYKLQVEKGGRNVLETKLMTDDTLLFWEEILSECHTPDDYLFGEEMYPSSKPVEPQRYTFKWHKWIKKGMGFSEDLYSEKHRELTATVDKEVELLVSELLEVAQGIAAQKAGHTTNKMVKEVYDVKSNKRSIELQKRIKNLLTSK